MTPDVEPSSARRRPAYDPSAGRRARLARRRAARGRRRLLRGLALVADSALVALVGAGVAARVVPPTSGWPLQVAALALPPLTALLAGSAVVWTAWAIRARSPRAWAGAAVHLALAALVASRYVPSFDGSAGVGGEALQVLTLNAGEDAASAALLAAEIVRFERPDLIALQEADVRRVTEDGRLAGPRVALGFLSSPEYTLAPRGEEGRVELISRKEITTVGEETVPLDSALDEESGVASRFVVAWNGRLVALYVVHFRSFERSGQSWSEWAQTLRDDFVGREREARFLKSVLGVEDLPFLVLGDFNATPDQWTYAYVAEGLTDALADQVGWAPTYPDERPLVQIDAVLASRHWNVSGARVLGQGLSDHRGVLVGLEWVEPVPLALDD